MGIYIVAATAFVLFGALTGDTGSYVVALIHSALVPPILWIRKMYPVMAVRDGAIDVGGRVIPYRQVRNVSYRRTDFLELEYEHQHRLYRCRVGDCAKDRVYLHDLRDELEALIQSGTEKANSGTVGDAIPAPA